MVIKFDFSAENLVKLPNDLSSVMVRDADRTQRVKSSKLGCRIT